MHIRTVPYHLVVADYDHVKNLQDTSHPTSRSQRFNTAHHSRLDILPIVPENTYFTHEAPPWLAYGYTLWHPLIVESQKMTSSHVVTIPSFLHEDLMRCHAAWISTNRLPQNLVQETVEAWQSTSRGRALLPILDGTKKWFIRLDQMSPKDSPLGGKHPSSTFEDVVVKICSSMRAWGCLQREREDAEAEGRDVEVELVLNEWNEGMCEEREFRVFVPPPAARGAPEEVGELKVTAVSQYRWHAPFKNLSGISVRTTTDLVHQGANQVLHLAMRFMEEKLSKDIKRLLLKHGLTFDVALQDDGSVQLVEMNPFGALSICGACLFNWVNDGRVLYGLDENAEFVITSEQIDTREEND